MEPMNLARQAAMVFSSPEMVSSKHSLDATMKDFAMSEEVRDVTAVVNVNLAGFPHSAKHYGDVGLKHFATTLADLNRVAVPYHLTLSVS